MSSIAYRPEIDGLRAFAVIPVILFHMGFSWIAGGYVGVDVFFVISGFLITSILKKELEAGTFSFREFWARRISRILPALLVVTVATLAATCCFVFKPDQPAIVSQSIAALLSVANVYFWNTSGSYWGTKAEESPFLHTWSLSVEEQFYLFLPVTMWLIFLFRPRLLMGFILFVIISSLSLFLWGSLNYPTATFYLLPTRAWELATGCLLALTIQSNRDTSRNTGSFPALAAAGLFMVLASCVFLPTLNGGLAIVVLGTALIIAFGQSGLCNTILTQRHVVHLGKMSYSLYLWHWPVLVFAGTFGLRSHQWLLLIPIYAFAYASYHLIERPTRRKAGLVPAISVCYVLTVCVAPLLTMSSPFYDTSDFEQAAWIPNNIHPHPDYHRSSIQIRLGSTQLKVAEAPPGAYSGNGIICGSGESYPEVVFLGDSHGCMWSDVIVSITEKLGIKCALYLIDGVPPYIDLPLSHEQQAYDMSAEEKYDYDNARLRCIEKWKPKLVIICTPWSNDTESEAKDLLEFLQHHSSKVLLIEQPPVLAIGDRNAMQYLCFSGIKPEVGVKKYLPIHEPDRLEKGRRLVRSLADTYGNCQYVPIWDLYVKGSEALVLDGKNVVYLDDDHLLSFGARIAESRLENAVSDALRGGSSDVSEKGSTEKSISNVSNGTLNFKVSVSR